MTERSKQVDYDELIGVLLVSACFLAALGILVYQIAIYLKAGTWQPISVITFLQFFENKWALTPSNWVGLYKVLDFIPLSLAILIGGGITAAAASR